MESEYIKTNVLDRDLDKFLNPYKADGTDVAYGHVLVKKIDNSRPRTADGPKDRLWNHANYPVTTYQAVRKDIDGVYTLIPIKNVVKPDWIAWLKAVKEAVASEVTLAEFSNIIHVDGFGHQTRDIAMKVHGATGLRPDIGIKQNPVASADSIYRVRSNQKDSQAPLVYVNTSGSPLEARTTIGSLTTVAYNHRGSPFHWIVIPPSSKDAFEAIIKSVFAQEIGEATCSDFVRHLSLWIMPNVLESWQLKFFEVKQAAGQLLIFFPGSYYWGFSAGHNVIELKQHAGKDWSCNSWMFCKLADQLCHRANRGQPGLFLGPLDGNNQQDGSEGGQMIDPTPRRTRKRKAVPYETVMELDASSPGSGPANPGAPATNEKADVGAEYPVEYPDPVDAPRNIFDDDVFAPGLGERHSPASNQENDYVDNRPEYAEDPYGYSQVGAEDIQQQQQQQQHQQQIEYLLQENHDLAQERDAALRECQELRQRNEQLTNNLQGISSERETRLQEDLDSTIQQREFFFAQMVEKDKVIDELSAQLARR